MVGYDTGYSLCTTIASNWRMIASNCATTASATGISFSNNNVEFEVEYGNCNTYKSYNYKDSTNTNNCSWDNISAATGVRIKYRNWWSDNYHYGALTKLIVDPKDRLREIIQSRQAPVILTSRKPILTPKDIREMRARETLCRVLGEDKFQKFLKDGFVSVRAKSGMVYQIFPGNNITNVYRDGEHIERLCVVLRGEFPPTDSLIMRYLIILNDESRFRGYAIKHQIFMKKPKIAADGRSLTEIFKELKNVA